MQSLVLNRKPAYEPAFRTRPAAMGEDLVVYTAADNEAVFVKTSVIEEIVSHSHDQAPNETIGFLAGRVFRDDHGVWTLVDAAFCCRHAEQTKVTVATTDADDEDVERWLHRDGLVYDRLGWWHSHYELRYWSYSGTDRGNQRLWCSRDYQVGLLVLVDQGVARVRCYRGPASQSLEPLYRDDGSSEPLPVDLRPRLPQHSTQPTSAIAPEALHLAPTTPSGGRVRWRLVSATAAAALLLAALAGFATGVIPSPTQLIPPVDAGQPIRTEEATDAQP